MVTKKRIRYCRVCRDLLKQEENTGLLTVQEVTTLLQINQSTLWRWEQQKKITPIRINRRGDKRYKKSYIDELLKENDEIN
jgi:predicted DNA-binding transcriptional regulator AlpA